jgi:dolichyl-phosphate-mannose-protein mannosyltransferase
VSAAPTADTDALPAGTPPVISAERKPGPPAEQAGGVPAAVRRRLAPFDARLEPYSWYAAGLVTFIAAVIRLINLDRPKGKIFDEVYYATDAHNLLIHGVEWDDKNNTAGYVVHPPLGKWMIALGERIFGYDEFGWRISAAVVGIISVLLLTRIARRMFGSTVLGCAAGLLMAFDGMHFVLSRTALLDIFLMFFILASFGALVLDRDSRRRRWLRAIEDGLDPSQPGRRSSSESAPASASSRAGRPAFSWPGVVPWWRLFAAVLFGCALGVKWSALWFAPAFLLLLIFWEVGARRSAGVRRPWRDTFLDEIGWLALCAALILVTYLATWSGWFFTGDGYFRHWLRDTGNSELPVIGALQNLWHYHHEAYKFHSDLTAKHTYQSWPWQWLLLGRPVAFHWSGDGPCGASSCASEVLLLGTPVLWWSFIPVLGGLAWLGIGRRDWRAAAIGLCVAAGLLPWFWFALDSRTMFAFYALPAEPFLVLAVVYVLGAIMNPAPAESAGPTHPGAQPAWAGGESAPAAGTGMVDRRLVGAIILGAYVLVVAACFAYFYPIYTGEIIPYSDWSARMWLGGRWI